MESSATPTPSVNPVNPPIEERKASFFSRHKFTLISIAILILALIPLTILTQKSKNPQPATHQEAMQQPTATPTQTMTPQNAQPTLDAADQQVQTALDNANTELNTVSQIDTSQDNTSNLNNL